MTYSVIEVLKQFNITSWQIKQIISIIFPGQPEPDSRKQIKSLGPRRSVDDLVTTEDVVRILFCILGINIP